MEGLDEGDQQFFLEDLLDGMKMTFENQWNAGEVIRAPDTDFEN
jgi:hypothetical protein